MKRVRKERKSGLIKGENIVFIVIMKDIGWVKGEKGCVSYNFIDVVIE